MSTTHARQRDTAGVVSLVRLAELDRKGGPGPRRPEHEALAARLSHELSESYERALMAGRQPPVVPLVANACSGCHVRLPTVLEQKIRLVRGVAACPRCLRLVYDPEWLAP
jgi:predicted  nucleic acid-binding Zn-ribbon protein